MRTTKKCCTVSWTNPGSNTPQNSSCTATYLLSQKPCGTLQEKEKRTDKWCTSLNCYTWIIGMDGERESEKSMLAVWPEDDDICIHPLNIVVFWPSARANMPFQSDAPEGSDTFQWPVIERDRVGGFSWWNGTR